jgi:hypothetical protein
LKRVDRLFVHYAFDARVIDAVVAPALGRGTRYRDELGGEAPVPAWL